MEVIIFPLAFLIAWFVMAHFVLPRLGVPT
jgi:hypothetical protein